MSGTILDQARASFAQWRTASAQAVGNEILTADLALPMLPGKHYIIESIALIGRCTVAKPLEPPVSGLFRVAAETPAPNTPWSAAQCGEPLPLSSCYCCEVALGTQFAIAYVAQPGMKISVPKSFTIRGILQCADTGGASAAGPGALSTLLIKALVIEEPDC